MYDNLIKLYLKLYNLKIYDVNSDNIVLDRCTEWTQFILSMIKKDFIFDILKYEKQYKDEYENYDIHSLIDLILQIAGTDYQYYYELLVIKVYLTKFEYTVRSGECGKCQLGIWEKNKDGHDICLFHKKALCKLEPQENFVLN